MSFFSRTAVGVIAFALVGVTSANAGVDDYFRKKAPGPIKKGFEILGGYVGGPVGAKAGHDFGAWAVSQPPPGVPYNSRHGQQYPNQDPQYAGGGGGIDGGGHADDGDGYSEVAGNYTHADPYVATQQVYAAAPQYQTAYQPYLGQYQQQPQYQPAYYPPRPPIGGRCLTFAGGWAYHPPGQVGTSCVVYGNAGQVWPGRMIQ
jgi:hypothetical protein